MRRSGGLCGARLGLATAGTSTLLSAINLTPGGKQHGALDFSQTKTMLKCSTQDEHVGGLEEYFHIWHFNRPQLATNLLVECYLISRLFQKSLQLKDISEYGWIGEG